MSTQDLIKAGYKIGPHSIVIGGIDPTEGPGSVEIGDWCVIGGESYLITHCPVKRRQGNPVAMKIRIGHDVYVGFRCIILPGTTIGSRVMIGAGSVVTNDIPSDVIWAGNPARHIRERDPKEIVNTRYNLETFGCIGPCTNRMTWSSNWATIEKLAQIFDASLDSTLCADLQLC